ncbi:type II toxin-antitoxin system VapC family toxin [Actinomyces slackii]|uniref:Ribonuclease VapC n=1 Tax=Actinomyces slackii TaxID=52774 RepID=A0A448KEZ4_9ACTO|nr:type II toxin-antitoxin system VapC family toxin [Actinomyces slackii]VEG75478.1 Probable ribonuclease VapC35 [Actinomyces slackii]
MRTPTSEPMAALASGTLIYVDTSAALKLLINEPESSRLARWLQDAVLDECVLCSSLLLHTELHCACARRAALKTSVVDSLLAGIELVDLSRDHLLQASRARSGLRAADAIHLTVATMTGAQALVTYDHEMSRAAVAIGMRVYAPGSVHREQF